MLPPAGTLKPQTPCVWALTSVHEVCQVLPGPSECVWGLTGVFWGRWGLSSCGPSFRSLWGGRSLSSHGCSAPCQLWPCPRNTSYHWETEPGGREQTVSVCPLTFELPGSHLQKTMQNNTESIQGEDQFSCWDQLNTAGIQMLPSAGKSSCTCLLQPQLHTSVSGFDLSCSGALISDSLQVHCSGSVLQMLQLLSVPVSELCLHWNETWE